MTAGETFTQVPIPPRRNILALGLMIAALAICDPTLLPVAKGMDCCPSIELTEFNTTNLADKVSGNTSAAQSGPKNSHSAQRTIMLDESCVPRNELSKDFSDQTFQARSWILPVEKPTNPKSEWVRKPHEFRFEALPGTPVRSVANGEVIYTGWYGAYGRVVLMNHGDPKKEFVYAHISKDFVQAGESVRAGQTIGLVGISGFEYRRTWKIARLIAAQPRPKPTPCVSFLEFDR